MKNLQHLLERLSQSLNRDKILKESVINIIKQHTSLELPESSVELKDGKMTIDFSPGVKNEVRLKESLILEDIRRMHSINIDRIFYK